jgi:acyl-CoA dehydrogenase
MSERVSLSDDTLAEIRGFVRERVVPLEPLLLAQRWDELEEAGRPLRAAVAERGWLAPHVEPEHGGWGLDLQSQARLGAELGFSPLGHGVFNCQAPDAANMELLALAATEEQKERWLRPLVAGAIRSCFGMTEPENAGSNPTMMSTRAVLDGDEWVLDGHKWFTTGAHGAAFCVVMAVTDPDAGKYGQASMILVPTDTHGFEHVRRIPIMGEEGWGNASHSEIRLNACRVPASNLIGGRGAGFALAQQRLGPGRIHHCMRWIGLAERAFDLMCRRAVERQLAPGKPLGTRQTIQNWIAESRTELDACRLLVMDVARQIEEVGAHAARNSISAIKFHAAGALQRVVDRSIQTHGALGMTDDTVLSWMYRHERGARIYDGPDEVHKSVVARRILRGYGLSEAR